VAADSDDTPIGVRVAHVNVRDAHGWVPPVGARPNRLGESSLGKHPAPWMVEALRLGEFEGVLFAQFVFWPGGDEDITHWVKRWLPELPATGMNSLAAIRSFLTAAQAHAHPLLLITESQLQGDELQVPSLVEGPAGPVLVTMPVRTLRLNDSPIGLVTWGPSTVAVGEESELSREQTGTVSRVAATIDHSVALDLLVAPGSEPSFASYSYAFRVIEAVGQALDSAERMLTEWELAALSRPSPDLMDELRRIARLRKCLPIITAALGPYRELDVAERSANALPSTVAELLTAVLVRAREVRDRAVVLEQRSQGSVGLLSQVTAGMQLQLAQEDARRQRAFQTGVAVLASVAVGPGGMAAWVDAADMNVRPGVLAAWMGGTVVLTLLALGMATSTVRHRVGRLLGRTRAPTELESTQAAVSGRRQA
jgi:hypothetical protein